MPLQRRLPKFGFTSKLGKQTDEIRLKEIEKLSSEVVDVQSLRAAGLISKNTKRVKLIGGDEINRAVKIKGIRVTKGARAMIESAGGSVEA